MHRDPGEKTARELFVGDAPAVGNTRDRLIDCALNLFYENGFHAVGIDRVISEVGVTKTTFYNHFESKDDLMIAAIERRDVWESRAFADRVRELGGGEPRRMLPAMFDVLDEWFSSPEYRGCLFINACSEFPARTDPIHQAAERHYVRGQESIAAIAREAGARDPQRLAAELALLLQGAVIHRLVMGEDHAAGIARRLAEAAIAAAIDEPPASGGSAPS